MYSFLFDPIYLNLSILALLIFLVMFLWRKLTILEGNFFILEKRVNLMKKESRESSMSKNLERSNIVMNEIFSDAISKEACKTVGICSFPLSSDDDHNDDLIKQQPEHTTVRIVEKYEDDIEQDDEIEISFGNIDLDKKIEEAIEKDDIINIIDRTDIDADNTSIVSEFTLSSDDKFNQKKLSKMNLDKLKNVCIQLNISADGTKSQLISKILECNK